MWGNCSRVVLRWIISTVDGLVSEVIPSQASGEADFSKFIA